VMSKLHAVNSKGEKILAMDPRGQEYSLDPRAIGKQGLKLDLKSVQAVDVAMNEIFQIVDSLKQEAGDSLSASDLVAEFFTPLVREGIIPDNLLLGAHSEVQQLLDKTFGAYKETLEEARKEKEIEKGKIEADFHGAGSKLDMVLAAGKKAGDKLTQLKEQFNPVKGTSEEKERAFQLGVQAASTAKSLYDAYSSVSDLASGKSVKDAADFLSGVEKEHENSTVFADIAKKVVDKLGLESAGRVGEYIAKVLEEGAELGDEALDKINEFKEKDWVKIVSASVSLTKEVGELAKETGLTVKEIVELQKALGESVDKNDVRKAALGVVHTIDTVVSGAIAGVSPEAGVAVSGQFARAVKAADVAEAATADELPDAEKIIALLGDGFVEALRSCGTGEGAAAFERAGVQIKKAFAASVKANELGQAILSKKGAGFDSLRSAAENAVKKGLGLIDNDPSEDPTAATKVQELLKDEGERKKIVEQLNEKQGEELLAQLERSEEEIAEYERQLVLIDDGGTMAANEKSIEKLIAELKSDRKQLELIAGLGSGLLSLEMGGVEIGEAVGKVSEQAVAQIAAPIKAAQLIIKLSANAIKAAERWRMWAKFRKDLDRATKARSALSPTIQNFYSNKKEQIAFHTIEDAMLAVQLAGSILGSVPEPITLAVGKTLSAVGSAGESANKIAGMVYDEVMLREGWAVTKEALDNPSNRSVGLKALRLNTTLAMHAIAWAGLEKRDPIARMILNTCGLNENTLADGGTTEKKVREYLETQLDEDRKFMDTEQIKTNWQPKDMQLTAMSWLSATTRGARDASPKLRPDKTPAIVDALKKIKEHADLKTLASDAATGDIDPLTLEAYLQDVDRLIKALQGYKPITTDNEPHVEMQAVITQYIQLANTRKLELSKLSDENNLALGKKAQNQK
ncbi:MAG TPA: hypothetical protein PLV92_11350, partial [Pirellulaceae bacterium]|nr:hypothetical protein [Pirellulaceae bacterium]